MGESDGNKEFVTDKSDLGEGRKDVLDVQRKDKFEDGMTLVTASEKLLNRRLCKTLAVNWERKVKSKKRNL